MEVFGSNTSRENLLKELEKLVQNHLKNLVENRPQKPTYIRLEKLAVGAFIQPWRLTVDRPGRPPTVRFLTIGAAVDRPGRPRPWNREQTSLLVDRPGRPGLSREQKLSAVDRVGRPALQPGWRARSVHIGRPTRSTDFKHGRPAEARTDIFGDQKLGFLSKIKSHKFTKNLQK